MAGQQEHDPNDEQGDGTESQSSGKSERNTWIVVGVIVAALLVVWSALVLGVGEVSFASHEFGDALAPLAAMIAGIALIFTAIAVKLQRVEIREQRKLARSEGRAHREEMARHRNELAATRRIMERQARALEDSVEGQRKMTEIYAKVAEGMLTASEASSQVAEADKITRDRNQASYWIDRCKNFIEFLRTRLNWGSHKDKFERIQGHYEEAVRRNKKFNWIYREIGSAQRVTALRELAEQSKAQEELEGKYEDYMPPAPPRE